MSMGGEGRDSKWRDRKRSRKEETDFVYFLFYNLTIGFRHYAMRT